MNILKKIEVVKELQVIFTAEQFVLTGSTIAMIQGVSDQASDIDIILIQPSDASFKMLDRFVSNFGILSAEKALELKSKGFYQFTYQGFKVDIFVKNNGKITDDIIVCDSISDHYDPKLQYDGIIISPLMKLVEAKKGFHRLKDFMQRKAWANKIFDYKLQEQELVTISTSRDYK